MGRAACRNVSGGIEVAVVGSGPAGLSYAYFLGRSGCAVTVFDPGEKAGGFLCQGAGGIKAALEIQGKKDITVLAWAGDGGTFDIGFQALFTRWTKTGCFCSIR